jgi:hypothetical protein
MGQELQQVLNPWETTLRKIYGGAASVTTVSGEWKTGKTDFALHLTEECKRLDLISRAAANIRCFKDKDCTIPSEEEVTYIDNFAQFGSWLFSGYRKAFLYDEAITSTPSRRAMSQLNTEWLKFIPELSKGRCHLLVITQEESITEKVFFHPTFHVASWEKIALNRKHPQFRRMVRLRGKEFPKPFVFRNLPATKIIFDPYRSASWQMTPDTLDSLTDDDLKICFDYGDGVSYDEIVKKYSFLHTRKDVSLRIRRAIKKLRKCTSSKDSGGYKSTENSTLPQ